MRNTPGTTAAHLGYAASRTLSEMQCMFSGWINVGPSRTKGMRKRLFCPVRTFWLFLSQVISGNISCAETVQKALAWLCYHQGKRGSQNNAGYCKARIRLRGQLIKRTSADLVEGIESRMEQGDLWQGRRVKIADGTCISMPDTGPNQKRFPQPKGQKKGCGFPSMRLVVVFSLATGAILKVAHGALAVHERTLFRRLWKWLEQGDILLADRGFCGYADFWFLLNKGVDCVMRNHQNRSKGVRKLKRLARGDLLVAWKKTSSKPKWLNRNKWRAIPGELTVRQITFPVEIKGFRTKTIIVVTTLLDPKAFPKELFIELYRKRWHAELFLRDIKTTMGMDVLKCKTPAMVIKELHMHIIAYNLIRCLMFKAAREHSVSTLRISFKGTVDILRQWAPLMNIVCHNRRRFDKMIDTLLHYIARNTVPERPNRLEPRARKRRPKTYQLLNKPRSEFKEIHHRNKYKKSLS